MTDWDNVVITTDISGLGQIAADVAYRFAEHKGIEVDDEDHLVIARAAWDSVKEMHEQAMFAREAIADIDEMTALPAAPNHRPEFDV